MHGIHHELERGVDEGTGLFRIEPFDQGGGAFEVGKEGGDGLALAVRNTTRLQRRLLSQNALG
jgi:hypothetical protein